MSSRLPNPAERAERNNARSYPTFTNIIRLDEFSVAEPLALASAPPMRRRVRSRRSSTRGGAIPGESQVIVNLAAANRDPALNANPNVLDLARDVGRHMAFGHSIHFCLGARLARMEGPVALGALVRRFPEMRLAVPVETLRWDHGDGLVLRGLSRLPVITGPARD